MLVYNKKDKLILKIWMIIPFYGLNRILEELQVNY